MLSVHKFAVVRSTLQILPEENSDGFPKAAFDVLPSLAALGVPGVGEEAYACVRLTVSEIGELVEGETNRRLVRCRDMEGDDAASASAETGCHRGASGPGRENSEFCFAKKDRKRKRQLK